MGFLSLVPGGIKIALLGLLVALAVGAYWRYSYVVGELEDTRNALAVTENTVSLLETENQRWAQAYEQALALAKETQEVQQEATAQMRKLNDVLSRHNLHALALAKPGLIERRVNDGTADIFSLFERATTPGGDTGSASEGDDPAPSTD